AAAPVTIAICPSNCVLTVDLLLCRDGGLGRVRLRPAYDRPCRGAPAHRRRTTLTPPSSHRPHPPCPTPPCARRASRGTRRGAPENQMTGPGALLLDFCGAGLLKPPPQSFLQRPLCRRRG